MRRDEIGVELVHRMLSENKVNYTMRMSPTAWDIMTSFAADEGWKSRNALIEHMATLYAISPAFAALVNASRDQSVNWDPEPAKSPVKEKKTR